MIAASYLQSIYVHPEHGRRLHRSKITAWADYEGFEAFVEGFLVAATMPREPTSKEDAWGWTPTLFEPGCDDRDPKVIGWRKGMFAADTVTLFIADLDNHHEDRTMVELEDIGEALRGLDLPHLLYTSFSHRPHRHKVRIVIPITREMTPDEAFTVFTWFNAAFDFQLDGSVYDPGDFLYGPPVGSEIVKSFAGRPLDVDAFLELADGLPEEAKTFVQRKSRTEFREVTAEDIAASKAALANITPTGEASISNPEFFHPSWIDLLHQRYAGGSRRQTALGLLGKAWVKSGGTLSRYDLQALQDEIDAEYGGYLRRTYGAHALAADLASATRAVATPTVSASDELQFRIKQNLTRLNRRRKKNHSQ